MKHARLCGMVRTKKKLNLQKQTINTLTKGQLQRVAGGYWTQACGGENPDSGPAESETACDGGGSKSSNGVYC
jgi:hypothetical protein